MCTSHGLAVWEISLSDFRALPFSSYYWHFRIEAMENCTVKVQGIALVNLHQWYNCCCTDSGDPSRNRHSPNSSINTGLKKPQSPLTDVSLSCSLKSLVEEIL